MRTSCFKQDRHGERRTSMHTVLMILSRPRMFMVRTCSLSLICWFDQQTKTTEHTDDTKDGLKPFRFGTRDWHFLNVLTGNQQSPPFPSSLWGKGGSGLSRPCWVAILSARIWIRSRGSMTSLGSLKQGSRSETWATLIRKKYYISRPLKVINLPNASVSKESVSWSKH